MHAMSAAFLEAPQFAIDEKEAEALAGGIAEVAKHYDIGMSEKTEAWVNLAMIAGAVYGPRIAVTFFKKEEPPAQAPALDPSIVPWNNTAR